MIYVYTLVNHNHALTELVTAMDRHFPITNAWPGYGIRITPDGVLQAAKFPDPAWRAIAHEPRYAFD